MKNRILPNFFLIVLMFLFALASKLAAQQPGNNFTSQQYSHAIQNIVDHSSGKLNIDKVHEILNNTFDKPFKLSGNLAASSDFYYLIPEICLVSHDGSQNAEFEYALLYTFEIDTIYFDFSNTPDWVDVSSLSIDYGQQQISIALDSNPGNYARSAPFTAIISVDDNIHSFTAYILQTPAPQSFIFVSPNFLSVPQVGGTTPPFAVTHFNLEEGWEAVVYVNWVSIDSATLTSNSISFQIDPNMTGIPRTTQIEMRAIGNPEVKDIIILLQAVSQTSFLVASPKINYIDAEGGSVDVLILTNLGNWDADILENPEGMITSVVNHPGSITLNIEVSQNLTSNPKIGKIRVYGGEPVISDTIFIYQSSPFLILNPREKLVSCTGESFGVNVISSGGDIIVSGNPDWVTVDVISNDYLHVVADENPTNFSRMALITVANALNPAISDELQIIQYSCAQPYIILSPNHQVAAWNDTILANPFTILSNIAGEPGISVSAPWLQAEIEGNNVFVELEVNTSNIIRIAEITVFDSSNPSVSDNASVIQSGTESFILITPEFQAISYTGGITQPYTVFNINVDTWEVHFDEQPAWVTDIQIFGNQVIFSIAPNDTPNIRQATFRVRDANNHSIFDDAVILQTTAPDPLLFITPRSKQLPHTANPSVNFQVTALNVDLWETDANSVPEWITVNPSGQNTLSLDVSENTLPETRSAIIKIYDTDNTDVTDSVFIFQYSALNRYLLAAPREQWVAHEGIDSLNFQITAVNVENWEADLEGIDWITQNTTGQETLSLNVSQNLINETRSAIIYIFDTTDPAVKDSVFVFQYSALDGYLLAAPREKVISHLGNSNVEFQVTAINIDEWDYDANTVPAWINVLNSGNEILTLSVDPNETLLIRQAAIRIYALNQPDIEDFVTIYQLAGSESYLIASPRARLIPHYGDDEVDFSITMVNIEGWEFTNTEPYEDWIIFQNLGDTIMRLSVAENPQAFPREARVVIQATDDVSIKDSVNIFQYSALDSYIIVNPHEQQTAGFMSETLIFNIITVNVAELDFEVYQSSDPDMIDQANSGLIDNLLSIVVTQNDTPQPREARIRVFDADNPAIADSIIIHQGYAYIILSPAAFGNIPWNETILKINSYSNIESYTVSKGSTSDWYQISKDATSWTDDPVSLSLKDSIYIRVQANSNTFQNRSSYLDFQYAGLTFNTLWFTQNAGGANTYAVSGRILIDGDDAQPLAGVRVVLYDSILTTNSAGHFMHPHVPENWTGAVTPLIDASLPIPYYFFPHLIEVSGDGITGNTVLPDFAAYRIQPSVVINPRSATICYGQILEPGDPGYPAVNISNTYGPSTYSWTSNPVDSVLLANPYVLYPHFGPKETTTYILEVRNYFRTTTDTFTITVNPLPLSVDFEGPLTVCSNQAGVIYQVIDPPPGAYYNWRLNSNQPGAYFANGFDPLSLAGNIAVVNWGSTPGEYTLSLYAYNELDCPAQPLVKTIEVTSSEAAPPTTVLRKSDDNMLYATDTLATSYQWGWFVKNERGELMQEYIIPDKNEWYCRLPVGHVYNPMLYHYFVITYNGDSSCESRSFHNLPVGLEETPLNDIAVYPNPNNGTFSIKFSNTGTQLTGIIEVYDIIGQKIFLKNLLSLENEQVIDLSSQATVRPGIYLLLVRTQDAVISRKILVQ